MLSDYCFHRVSTSQMPPSFDKSLQKPFCRISNMRAVVQLPASIKYLYVQNPIQR